MCEDIWAPEAAQLARAAGAQLLLVINASPYEIHKQREREEVARARVRDVGLPLGVRESASAARTSSSSTATRSSWMRRASS